MKKYKDFKEYMEDHYLDEIMEAISPIVIRRKDSFEDEEFYEIKWVELSDATVCGVTFKDLGNDWLEIRTSVDAVVEISGRTRYGYDSDSVTRTYNVFFRAILKDGLNSVSVTGTEEYNKAVYDKDKSLSQNLVPYMYEEDVDRHAEDFLRRNFEKALLQPMPLPVEEIAKSMGMEIYYAPLGDKIFGKTYFGKETVTVYDSIIGKNEHEITTRPGTMLINPNVYFMYNIGTANNTIIHECVHWDRHRRAFELQRLLDGDSSHISCEIVETYDGIPEDSPALKWMEWQANQLAPRILMPAKMAHRVYSDFLVAAHQADQTRRYAENVQDAVGRTASFFGVSLIAAKLRLMELGCEEVLGAFVYCDGELMPPFAFHKKKLDRNQSFVIDEQNLTIQLIMNPTLGQLFADKVLVYANHMLCLNNPKYVYQTDAGNYELTEYGLEHVDECCFVFNRKFSASDKYSDTFYRRCFLCREMDADDYVPAEYDPEHEINQSKMEMQTEIDKIMARINAEADDMKNKMLGGFGGGLKYYMDHYNVTLEELQDRCGVSTVTISGYRNGTDTTLEKGTVLALCKGMYMTPAHAEHLLDLAGFKLTNPTPSNIFVRILITEHMDDTWKQWVEKLIMANIAKDWIPSRNNIVKEVREEKN